MTFSEKCVRAYVISVIQRLNFFLFRMCFVVCVCVFFYVVFKVPAETTGD
jgi:hypothetical protein